MKKSAILLVICCLWMVYAGCKKETFPPEGNLIVNYSFEENGVFSLTGWDTSNAQYSTIVPENGGDFSVKLFPGAPPDEGYVDYTINGLVGEKTITMSCQANAFGGWLGTATLKLISTGETSADLATATWDQNNWGAIDLSATATFAEGDVLKLHLSAGFSPVTEPGQFVLFDLVTLSIN